MRFFLKKVFSLLGQKEKVKLIWLVLFSLLISFIEILGISVIMPFLNLASNFSLIYSNEYYSYIYNLLNFKSDINFVLLFGVLLIFFYMFRSAVNLYYTYFLSSFSLGLYYTFSSSLFRNYLKIPYKEFVNKNSSALTKTIITEASNLSTIISSILFMVSEVFVIILIYILLLCINFEITLILTFILVLNAILMVKTVSSRIKKLGFIREESQKIFYEIINRSFGNFKLIRLLSNDYKILEEFSQTNKKYIKSNIMETTFGTFPRLFLEAISFCLILLIILYFIWSYKEDISKSISLITIFVLALYRLMPSINRIMTSYNKIMFNYKSLDIIYEDLASSIELCGGDKITFTNKIDIKNLSFEYEKSKPVLENINLSIKKGSKVAFVGESGSGKSTLVDIIMGFHLPTSGAVFSDNTMIDISNIKSWRAKIGYIPQDIYLFDGTIGENISFGSEYDRDKIDKVLKQAQIYDFLATKSGQDTFVGEGGTLLSGGQKQRIAIARALYLDPEILVLDEATSALDTQIEEEIMKEIYTISEGKTLIIIAHRLSTIEGCKQIYTMVDGNIYDSSLKEII